MSASVTRPIPRSAKVGFVTHCVPSSEMHSIGDVSGDPEAGDVVAGQIIFIGKHTAIESRESRRIGLFMGDLIIGAYGNRYATDQFEGYVGPRSETFHLLSVGAVCGQVKSKNELMTDEPTLVRFLGFVLGPDGKKINIKKHGMTERTAKSAGAYSAKRPKTIVVVGASMNAGKTTTVANSIRGISSCGYRVAAAKITGTACSKDTWLMHDAGALAIYDFSDCGHPSTYLLSLEELKSVYKTLLARLVELEPEVVLFEIADGLLQRETAMLLTDPEFKRGVDHIVFAGVDSLSVESGIRMLKAWGYDVAAISGLVSCSPLGIQECALAAPGIPTFGAVDLSTGSLLGRIGLEARVNPTDFVAGSGLPAGGASDSATSARLELLGHSKPVLHL